MNRILLVVLAAVLISSIFANGCTGYIFHLATINDIDVWADNSSPPQYFVDVVSEEPTTCDHFDSYNVTRAGNTTMLVDIFNRRCCTGCPDDWYWDEYRYVEHTIPLGSDFIPGGNYTVVVNNVTETFVAQ